MNKKELYEEVEKARYLHKKSEKDFAKYLVKNYPVDSVGDGTSISIEFKRDSFYVNVNADRGEIRIAEYTTDRQTLKKILEFIKEVVKIDIK